MRVSIHFCDYPFNRARLIMEIASTTSVRNSRRGEYLYKAIGLPECVRLVQTVDTLVTLSFF
jgi:hypothetical protein